MLDYWTNLYLQSLLLVAELEFAVIVALHEKVCKVEPCSIGDALLQVPVLLHTTSEAVHELLQKRKKHINTPFIRGEGVRVGNKRRKYKKTCALM